MLLYLDANCLHRPLNDQSQVRIRRETEAVLTVLTRIVAGADQFVWSSALTLELTAHPELEIRNQLLAWKSRSQIVLTSSKALRTRIEEFVHKGLKSLDAAHVAFAEAGGCDALLSCDDRLVRRATRLQLSLRVLNPIEYVEGLDDA